MSIRIPKYIGFILAFAFTLALYWPAMNGTPIWDDYLFWFEDPNLRHPHLEFWKNFAWPLSISMQKILLTIFKKNYTYYHTLNLLFHFANSWLVYWFARYLRFRYPFIIFLLFLVHPTAVIATAWMIQLKTLMCFFFALLSLLAFLKGNQNMKWMIASWIFFALSVLSKSASISLPAIFLLISYRNYKFSKIWFVIPFFLISLWGTWKLLGSQVALEAGAKAAIASKVKDIPIIRPVAKPELQPAMKPEQKPENKKKKLKKKIKPQVLPAPPAPMSAPPQPPSPEPKSFLSKIKINYELISQTLNYYFWQVLIPGNNVPVKGLNFERPGFMEAIHIFFLICMVIILWKDTALYYLFGAHILLLPFLGIIPAPFMNVTWVSDQHLYLVLPALIGFWMKLVEKIPWKYSAVIPSLFVVLFSWKTFETTPMYKNEIVFYEKCLEYNPYNVPMSYNLALARIRSGDVLIAYELLKIDIERAKSEPLMLRNYFYPYMAELYIRMKEQLGKHED